MEYRIERLSATNIGLLTSLFHDVFKQAITIDFLRRKYDTEVFGAEYVGYIAFDDQDTVVAYYGVTPCHLTIQGQTCLAAQSVDTMTHPNHRHKGLFITLARKTYALARELGIKLVFGFPNQNSTPGFQKLDWKFATEQLQLFSAKVPTIAYARIIMRSNVLRRLYLLLMRYLFQTPLEQLKFADDDIDGVKHDNKFLGYKKYNKTFVTEIAGVKIWFRPDTRLKIGAVLGLTQSNTSDFLRLVKSFAARLGCNEVVFMTTTNSHLYNALSTCLPALNGFPIGYIPLSDEAPSLASISFEYCDLDIF